MRAMSAFTAKEAFSKFPAIARKELVARYERACKLFPRTLEIPLELYLRRNMRAACKNIRTSEPIRCQAA